MLDEAQGRVRVFLVSFSRRAEAEEDFWTWGRTHIWYRPDRNTEYCP